MKKKTNKVHLGKTKERKEKLNHMRVGKKGLSMKRGVLPKLQVQAEPMRAFQNTNHYSYFYWWNPIKLEREMAECCRINTLINVTSELLSKLINITTFICGIQSNLSKKGPSVVESTF